MKNLMKKIVVSIVGLSMVVMMVPGIAQGVTAEELQAQIATLTAQLAALQAQLTALTGTPAAAACTFTRNLYPGMSGADVQCLQQYLNGAGFALAASGVGSAGNETQYFGPLTQAAVKKWQDANGVVYGAYGGYFGPVSQAKYVALPGGVTPVTPVTPGVGTEGSYTVALSASPVSRTVNGGAGIEAYGFDVTAYGSDITIGRVDLQASSVYGSTTESPGNLITAVKVYKDSVSDANLNKTITSPVFNLDTSSVYYTQLAGLSVVVPKDTTVKVLIVIDTSTAFDTSRTLTLNVYGSGIRGTDTIGLSTYTALATTRILTVQRPGNAVLTLSTSSANPNSANIQSDATLGVQDPQPVLAFNAKATAGDAQLTRLEINHGASAGSEAIPSILYLYAGDALVASGTPNASKDAVTVFSNFKKPIAQNETVAFTVKAAWGLVDRNNNYFTANINSTATTTSCAILRTDGSSSACTVSATIQGNTHQLFDQGVKITFVSATATGGTIASTQSGVATGTFKFKVQPFGGTLTQIVNATKSSETIDAVFVEAYWSSSTTVGIGASSTVDSVITRVLGQSPARALNDGEEGEVSVTMTVTSTTTYGSGTLRFKIEGIQWTAVGAATTNKYQGEFYAADNGAKGNLTDTWYTPWVTLQ